MAAARASPAASRAALFSVICGQVTAPFSVTLSSVALGPIGVEVGASLAALQWLVGAFALSFAALLLPCAALADRFGRRKLFVAGVGLFALASLLAACAPSLGVLLASRVLSGISGALTAASGPAILTHMFRQPEARSRAFGVFGSAVGVALALGAIAGGPLLAWLGWRGAFLLGVPIAVASLASAAHIEESWGGERPFDVPGALAGAVCLGCAIAYGTSAPLTGFATPSALAWLASAALAGFAFLMIEAKSRSPMLELGWFKIREFSGVNVLCLSFTALWVALFVFVPLYVQVAFGHSPAAAGLWMLLLVLPSALAPLLIVRLSRRHSPRLLLAVGSLIASAGCAAPPILSSRLGLVPALAVGLAIVGLGAGCIQGLLDRVALTALPEDRSAVAAGAFNAMRLVGDAIGAVVPGAILSRAVALALSADPSVASESAGAVVAAASAIVAGNLPEAQRWTGDGAALALARLAPNAYSVAMGCLFAQLSALGLANVVLTFFCFRRRVRS